MLIHSIYSDNGSLVNILCLHCLESLLEEVYSFIQPTTISVIRFARQAGWLKGKLSLPFTLSDYESSLYKTILAKFIIIKAPYHIICFLEEQEFGNYKRHPLLYRAYSNFYRIINSSH